MKLLEVEVTPEIMKCCFCLFPCITDLARAIPRRGTVNSQHLHGDQKLHSSPFPPRLLEGTASEPHPVHGFCADTGYC